jgi:hypothetical protein
MGKLPLNDPRWCAMKAAIDLREQQTGAHGLAIRDLAQAMVGGKLRSMRRNLASGESELLAASFWETHFIGYLSPLSVTIYRQTDIDRHRTDEYGNLVADRLDDLFYVWRPDFDGLYYGARDEDEPLQPIDRAKVVLRDLYPTKAEMPRSLKAAHRAVMAECEKRDWQPPSEDTVQRAAEELGYRPPRKRR